MALSVTPPSGQHATSYRGQSWLGAGMVSVLANQRWYRSSSITYPEVTADMHPSGKLLLTDLKAGEGEDKLGGFQTLDLSWKLPDTGMVLVTGFRLYLDQPFLVFVQRFPHGFKSCASGNWIVPSVVFPHFLVGFDDRNDLYSWTSGGMFTHRFGYGNAATLGGTARLRAAKDFIDATSEKSDELSTTG